MKTVALGFFAIVAACNALAGNVCTNGRAEGAKIEPGATPLYKPTPGQFVMRSFPVRCSTNVEASTEENIVSIAVCAISLKGKSIFEGVFDGWRDQRRAALRGNLRAGNGEREPLDALDRVDAMNGFKNTPSFGFSRRRAVFSSQWKGYKADIFRQYASPFVCLSKAISSEFVIFYTFFGVFSPGTKIDCMLATDDR
ncbi:MAG: hypothetical protein LBJ76_04545 [Candidatus Accumulibacter sp.]|jgi:hypothetical protein|nr:hypothetical protein [Accumulibacter sp.]